MTDGKMFCHNYDGTVFIKNVPEDYDKAIIEFDGKKRVKKLKKKKLSKTKVARIEYGIVKLESKDSTVNSKHTAESKAILSEKRKKRKKQPREGQTTKSTDFYKELITDYKNKKVLKVGKENFIRLDNEDKKTINNFLKKHKKDLSEVGIGDGVLTEFCKQQNSFSEVRVDQVLFDPHNDDTNSFEAGLLLKMDWDNLCEEIEEKVEWFKENGYDQDEINEFVLKMKREFYEENEIV